MMNAISLESIYSAHRIVRPEFLHSPQYRDPVLSRLTNKQVLVKVETLNPLRSFKGRGADYLLEKLQPEGRIACASSGNFGQALALCASYRDIPVTVYTPESTTFVKRSRMALFGAQVVVAGRDYAEAQQIGRAKTANDSSTTWIVDGEQSAVAEGAGTIALELLECDPFDVILVPVGDGALITGIATVLRAHRPHVRIVGVGAAGAPAMYESWKAGEVVLSGPTHTIASGISTSAPLAASVSRIQSLVDDMVQVTDTELLEAIDIAERSIGVLLEPAGAAALAALLNRPLPESNVAIVLTGGNHPNSVNQFNAALGNVDARR